MSFYEKVAAESVGSGAMKAQGSLRQQKDNTVVTLGYSPAQQEQIPLCTWQDYYRLALAWCHHYAKGGHQALRNQNNTSQDSNSNMQKICPPTTAGTRTALILPL